MWHLLQQFETTLHILRQSPLATNASSLSKETFHKWSKDSERDFAALLEQVNTKCGDK